MVKKIVVIGVVCGAILSFSGCGKKSNEISCDSDEVIDRALQFGKLGKYSDSPRYDDEFVVLGTKDLGVEEGSKEKVCGFGWLLKNKKTGKLWGTDKGYAILYTVKVVNLEGGGIRVKKYIEGPGKIKIEELKPR